MIKSDLRCGKVTPCHFHTVNKDSVAIGSRLGEATPPDPQWDELLLTIGESILKSSRIEPVKGLTADLGLRIAKGVYGCSVLGGV